MARGNIVDDDDENGSGSEDDQDFDAENEDSDTSPKKGHKRRKSVFIDDAASEEDDEVSSSKLATFKADIIIAMQCLETAMTCGGLLSLKIHHLRNIQSGLSLFTEEEPFTRAG